MLSAGIPEAINDLTVSARSSALPSALPSARPSSSPLACPILRLIFSDSSFAVLI